MLICKSCFRPHIQKFMVGPIGYGLRITRPKIESKRGIASRRKSTEQQGHEDSQGSRNRGRSLALKTGEKSKSKAGRKAMEKHIEFLGDRLKLSDDVKRTLQRDEFEKALEVVRHASKDMQCVVSWNHLINWQLGKGKLNAAMKTFNEMKKRGQRPDSHTYTILFRGFAASENKGAAVEKGLRIYESLTAPNSDVQPNSIHTNAILKVCSRAGALDALFGIAAKIPSKGSRAADSITFTTILNALHEHATRDGSIQLSHEEKTNLKTKTIIDGRRMWDDISRRWRAGELKIDEQLTCAMGRLLLISQSQNDVDDVFSLLQQTMNIPRPFPRLGTPERDVHEPSAQSKPLLLDDSNKNMEGSSETSEPSEDGLISRDNFKVYTPPRPGSRYGGYLQPGTRALSVAMDAMQKLSQKSSAKPYWDVFTKEFHVNPDKSNYAELLRVLRISRASSQALEVLMEMDRKRYDLKHFRIALSACVRDKHNPNAFLTAGKILDLMQQNFAEPDIESLHSYLELAMATAPKSGGINKQNQLSPREIEEKFSAGRRIQRALFRLEPQIINIKSYLDFGGNKMQSKGIMEAQHYSEAIPDAAYNAEALNFLVRVIGAYDKLIYTGMTAREEHSSLKERRAILDAAVKRRVAVRHLKVVPGVKSQDFGHSDRDSNDKGLDHDDTEAADWGTRKEQLEKRQDSRNEDTTEVESHNERTRKIQFNGSNPSTNEKKKEEESQVDYNVLAAEEERLAAEKVRRDMNL